jgi:chromosome segregation ATPase
MSLFISTRKVKELQDRVDKLETAFKSLDLEWSSTYDKFRSILARIAKREERLRDANEVNSPAGFQEAEANPPASSLDPISQRILARRNRIAQRSTQ